MNISYFSPEQIIDFCFNSSIEELKTELFNIEKTKRTTMGGEKTNAHLDSAAKTLELIIARKKNGFSFSEVKTDYFDDDEGVYYIDVFMSDDENAIGKLAAKYDPDTDEIEWQVLEYKDHPQIMEEINDLKVELHRKKMQKLWKSFNDLEQNITKELKRVINKKGNRSSLLYGINSALVLEDSEWKEIGITGNSVVVVDAIGNMQYSEKLPLEFLITILEKNG